MKNYTIKDMLDNTNSLVFLDSQKEYREKMATFIRMHVLRARAIQNGVDPKALPTISMLVIAETGSGKTFVASQIAKASGVRILTVDCSSLSRAGWKGISINQILTNAKEQIQEPEDFATSVIHFDEFDKLRFHFDSSTNSIEGNPQYNFLSLFDGSTMNDGSSGTSTSIDTSKMSFLFSGAFSDGGLKHIIRRRLAPPKTIGFGVTNEELPETNLLRNVTMEDIKRYGIMEELCGRIGHLYYLPPLSQEDYRTLIKGKENQAGSLLQRYQNLFRVCNVDVDITDEACKTLATDAMKNTLGARSVNPAVYGYFQKAVMMIEMEPTINRVVLDSTPDGQLKLRYGYGKRIPISAQSMHVDETFKVPDVNFGIGLQSDEDLKRLREFMIELYKMTRNKNIGLLAAFLDCALYYLCNFFENKDHTLESLEKLTKVTYKDGAYSTFDSLMLKQIEDPCVTKPKQDELRRRYNKFLQKNILNSSHYFVDAIREIRRNWYDYLNRMVG